MKTPTVPEGYDPSGLQFVDRSTGLRCLMVDDGEPSRTLVGWLLEWNENKKTWRAVRRFELADFLKLA